MLASTLELLRDILRETEFLETQVAQATTETCSPFSPIFGSLQGQGAPKPIARTRTQQRLAGPRNNTARVPENLELLLHWFPSKLFCTS